MAKKPDAKLRLPEGVSVEDALRAMLHTPPPPAGDPSTRKQTPKKKPGKKKG
jgi:hypothetical protein